MHSPAIALLLPLVISLLGPVGCRRATLRPPGEGPIVLVGVDGATWNVLSPMLDQGRLPRLAALYRSGSAGLMRSTDPFVTAPTWTSVLTGRPASVHGIRGNAVRVPGQYVVRPVTADMRLVPAVWTIAAARGIGVGVAGWPATFPAERVEGFFISDAWDPESGTPPRGIHPDGALGPGGVEPLPVPDRFAPLLVLDAGLKASFEQDLGTLAQSQALARVYRPRLLMLRFQSIDRASHAWWPYLDPALRERLSARGLVKDTADTPRFEQVIPAAYEFFDAWLGILMDGLPETSTVVIVSNHGFRGATATEEDRFDPPRFLGGLMARDADGNTDWSRTLAFSLPTGDPRRHGIWINQVGRDPEGLVDTDGADQVARSLEQRLGGIVSEDGTPLLAEVRRPEPRAPDGPEIEIVTRQGGRREDRVILRDGPSLDASHPALERRLEARGVPFHANTAGDFMTPRATFGLHDASGILLAAGPGIVPGRTEFAADLVDVLPTLLHLAGIPLADDLPGHVIEACLVERPDPGAERVATWSGLPEAPEPVMLPVQAAARQIEALREASHLD